MTLTGKRVAILVEDLYQDQEVWYPFYRLKEEGVQVITIGSGRAKEYKSKYGYPMKEDLSIDDAKPESFDGVVIPGGYAPDQMRRHPAFVQFVRKMVEAGKPTAAICHGPWLLASAEVLKGKKVTGFFAIQDDLVHAGATFLDQEVVQDGCLVTSRKPDDLPAFLRTFLKALESSSLRAPKGAKPSHKEIASSFHSSQ